MNIVSRIPVTLLTGFLGAGKTSYLNRLLRRGLPQDSLILVNDFGRINVDADLIEYRDERIMRLSNGCVCCTLGGSLGERLAELLRQPSLPAAIYLEASGIADPARIADLIRVSPRLELRQVVCLVDASQAEHYSRNPMVRDTWHRQLAAATHVVVNRLPPSRRLPPALAQPLARSRALVEHDSHAGDEMPLSPPARPEPSRSAGAGRWHSVSLHFAGAVDGSRIEHLLRCFADVLFRAKGILLRQGKAHAEVLQLSGGRISWHPAFKPASGGQLVCIGAAGPRMDELAARLAVLAEVQEGR